VICRSILSIVLEYSLLEFLISQLIPRGDEGMDSRAFSVIHISAVYLRAKLKGPLIT
jgi:hypothetical protein